MQAHPLIAIILAEVASVICPSRFGVPTLMALDHAPSLLCPEKILEKVAAIALQVQQGKDLEFILQRAINDIRMILQCDRVLIYRFLSETDAVVLYESVSHGWLPVLGELIYDPCFNANWLDRYRRGRITFITDVAASPVDECYRQLLTRLQVQANLVVPVLIAGDLWGLLIVHQCRSPRYWSMMEVQLVQQIALQISSAIYVADLKLRQQCVDAKLDTLVIQSPAVPVRSPVSPQLPPQSQLSSQSSPVPEARVARDRHVATLKRELTQAQQLLHQHAKRDYLLIVIALRFYQAAQSQVQELERLNQLKDDFLNTISHELRTPISTIKMVTEMLTMSLETLGVLADETNLIRHYLQVLQDESAQEINLINDLLDLTQLEASTEPLHLTAITLQVYIPHLAEPWMERVQANQQHLHIQIPEDLPLITTDLVHLERILTELFDNACKYTPVGEQIRVSVHPHSDRLEICISNTGIEIPMAERDRIFEKFYRIPNSDPWKYAGTGLGLALVKKRVEQLNGTITVCSSNGETTFRVRLPYGLNGIE